MSCTYIETFLGQKYSLFAKFFNVIRHQKRKIQATLSSQNILGFCAPATVYMYKRKSYSHMTGTCSKLASTCYTRTQTSPAKRCVKMYAIIVVGFGLHFDCIPFGTSVCVRYGVWQRSSQPMAEKGYQPASQWQGRLPASQPSAGKATSQPMAGKATRNLYCIQTNLEANPR